MVKLDRIYTKTGDTGSTGLGNGKRVAKDDARVEAYGTVDEANAALGVVVALAAREAADAPAEAPARELADLLRSVQHDLFDLGADLCCPIGAGEKPAEKLRITPGQTARLERAIDLHNHDLAALNSFVLPGGSTLAAAMHVARTVARRGERCVVSLQAAEPAATNPEAIKYLNRLSDLLFVLSRVANGKGTGDVLWVPGANRPK
ncbi:MAG: cob(I)yrinic acid a,c-diamide adenosyltransferase [Phycisphaerales bacterium]